MRSAARNFLLASAALGLLAACKKQEPSQDQNLIIDSGNIPANADIEALPPDESSGTSTDELENGSDNPDVNAPVNAPDNQTDSY